MTEVSIGNTLFKCAACATTLARQEEVVSKAFQGSFGRAYLFNNVHNVTFGARETRLLMTGEHVVCDVYCAECNTYCGWKYEAAKEESQQYKVGKFIIEKRQVLVENNNET